MKLIRILALILLIGLLSVSCKPDDLNQKDIKEETYENIYDNVDDDIEINENIDEETSQFKSFFEDKLGYRLSDLSSENKKEFLIKFEKNYKIREKEDYYTKRANLHIAEVAQKLRTLGYEIPMLNFLDVAMHLKQHISAKEYNKLLKIAKDIVEAESNYVDTDAGLEADNIINQFGLSGHAVSSNINGEMVQLGLYSVKNGKITRNTLDTYIDNDKTIKTDKIHQKIWDKITQIIPPKYQNMISKYEMGTDAMYNLTGAVDVLKDKSWIIWIDQNDLIEQNGSFNTYGIGTIIHEMAHIISLNTEQIEENSNDPTLYKVDEGTLKKEAYLNVFYHKFWEFLIAEHEKIGREKFYKKYEKDFVTEYASSNPREDFSESFRYFVIEKKPTDNSTLSQKLLFFYQYPELVEVRNYIRTNLKENEY